ncbi:MAG: CheR family methyltransferase [Opitutales bacterium]
MALPEKVDEDFEFIRETVYRLSRISLGPQKKTMVMSRIAKRMRALGHASAKEYCAHLRRPSGRKELSSLIDVISTNHTYFFRESGHFEYLQNRLLADRPRTSRPFKMWSAACSSGEEPYSMGMLLMEHAKRQFGFQWSAEATDISSIVLAKAEAAEYTEAVVARVPEQLRSRYLESTGTGQYRVVREIRKRIRFRQLNLFEVPAGFPRDFELIVCRNVMIYFDRATREQLVNLMVDRLLPNGTLFVGHSESLSGIRHPLKMIAPAIFVKV